MYTIKNITYADAGKYLLSPSAKGFSIPKVSGLFTERDIDLSKLQVNKEFILFDAIKWINPNIKTYSDAKRYVINKRYSNDDQIAIILNKDNSEEDALAYEKMQEWREWASIVAHKIIDKLNENENER